MYKKVIKRLLDLLISFLGITILLLPMAVVALIIVIDSPGPVFFTQDRVGKGKKIFRIVKFRSMPLDVDHNAPTHEFKGERSLSEWQKFIRKFSIDELPQLFNIFIGQMSVIGPRPALWNQYDLIEERDRYGANDVTPGLTGWAQINGRDELPIPVKAKLDGEYVEKMSFGFDLRCFFGTVSSVIRHKGYREGGTGNKNEEDEGTDTNE